MEPHSATTVATDASASAKILYDAITFDDVLLLPGRSDFVPIDADTSTQLTRNIRLNVPLLSAPMDTVTEAKLAIALAQHGGLGDIHKNMSPDDQVREVTKVKRSANGVIREPQTLPPDQPVSAARHLMREQNISGVPITDNGSSRGKVVGILTRRDLKFLEDDARPIAEVMSKDPLITGPAEMDLESAERIAPHEPRARPGDPDYTVHRRVGGAHVDQVDLDQARLGDSDLRGELRGGDSASDHLE